MTSNARDENGANDSKETDDDGKEKPLLKLIMLNNLTSQIGGSNIELTQFKSMPQTPLNFIIIHFKLTYRLMQSDQ